MNKTQFLKYFKKKKLSSNDDTEITVTKVTTSATQNISNAELYPVEDEIKKSVKRPSKYQNILQKSKEKLEFMLIVLELRQQLRSLLQSILNTLLNSWEIKFKERTSNVMFKKAGRPNLLEGNLIKKSERYCHRNESCKRCN